MSAVGHSRVLPAEMEVLQHQEDMVDQRGRVQYRRRV